MANSSLSGVVGPVGATGPTGSGGATGPTGATGAAGAAGNVVLISDQVLGSDTASFAFTSIAGYKHLKMITSLRTDRSATEDLLLVQFNSDVTAGHYFSQRELCAGTSVSGAEFLGSFAGYASVVVGASATAAYFASAELMIADYLDTAKKKTCISAGLAPSGKTTGLLDSFRMGMLWDDVSAITRIDLKPGVGTVFKTGSRATLYGLS